MFPAEVLSLLACECGSLSSFGYSGTIVHMVVLNRAPQGHATPAAAAILYRRRSFLWSERSPIVVFPQASCAGSNTARQWSVQVPLPAADVLRSAVLAVTTIAALDDDQSLLEQGLDSLAAQGLLSLLAASDVSVPYESLLYGSTPRELEAQLVRS